jgi:hypothetical protein
VPDRPIWFKQLQWSPVWSVAKLTSSRDVIPSWPGCYVFTRSVSVLRPNDPSQDGDVLYVGKAANLRSRLGGYLVEYAKTRPTNHKGRQFIFAHRHENGDDQTFVRWVEYGGKLGELEANLCNLLAPEYTDRWEMMHEEWDDGDEIDPRLLP